VFTLENLHKLVESPHDCIISAGKYSLYKMHRNDKIEYNLNESYESGKVNFSETILVFYLPYGENHEEVIYLLLRNCLLVEKKGVYHEKCR